MKDINKINEMKKLKADEKYYHRRNQRTSFDKIKFEKLMNYKNQNQLILYPSHSKSNLNLNTEDGFPIETSYNTQNTSTILEDNIEEKINTDRLK